MLSGLRFGGLGLRVWVTYWGLVGNKGIHDIKVAYGL